jgi:hypothetical protein
MLGERCTEILLESVRTLKLNKAECNPFFVKEVIRALIDSGHIIREDGHWRDKGDRKRQHPGYADWRAECPHRPTCEQYQTGSPDRRRPRPDLCVLC